jgi:hypothetical protein
VVAVGQQLAKGVHVDRGVEVAADQHRPARAAFARSLRVLAGFSLSLSHKPLAKNYGVVIKEIFKLAVAEGVGYTAFSRSFAETGFLAGFSRFHRTCSNDVICCDSVLQHGCWNSNLRVFPDSLAADST